MDRTAIIVNDHGESFIGWRSTCSLSENGVETYYSVPLFLREKTIHYSSSHLWPADAPTDRPYVLNRPYVFSSVRSAERAMKRMWGRIAIVS